LLTLLRRHWTVLAITFLVALIAQDRWTSHHGTYRGVALFSQEHDLIDWMLAQKLLL
jgi:hypothetical protein